MPASKIQVRNFRLCKFCTVQIFTCTIFALSGGGRIRPFCAVRHHVAMHHFGAVHHFLCGATSTGQFLYRVRPNIVSDGI